LKILFIIILYLFYGCQLMSEKNTAVIATPKKVISLHDTPQALLLAVRVLVVLG
jgi:hypothetical protein